jgi:hypothetical protein
MADVRHIVDIVNWRGEIKLFQPHNSSPVDETCTLN